MNYSQIKRLQKEHGFLEIQEAINNGNVWHMEGTIGREAMDMLRSGACMLPKEEKRDFYGNRIPSRDVLKEGSTGTYQNCKRFWESVENGDIHMF